MSAEEGRGSRYLQTIAARSFHVVQSANERLVQPVFTYSDVRLEAAFRAWLRELDLRLSPPTSLPSETVLGGMAALYDCHYGVDIWWTWPIWSSCSRCSVSGFVNCPECRRLAGFCEPRRSCTDGEEQASVHLSHGIEECRASGEESPEAMGAPPRVPRDEESIGGVQHRAVG